MHFQLLVTVIVFTGGLAATVIVCAAGIGFHSKIPSVGPAQAAVISAALNVGSAPSVAVQSVPALTVKALPVCVVLVAIEVVLVGAPPPQVVVKVNVLTGSVAPPCGGPATIFLITTSPVLVAVPVHLQ